MSKLSDKLGIMIPTSDIGITSADGDVIYSPTDPAKDDNQEKTYFNSQISYIIDKDVSIEQIHSFLEDCEEYENGYEDDESSFCFALVTLLSSFKNYFEFKVASTFIIDHDLSLLREFLGDNILTFEILDEFVSQRKSYKINKIKQAIFQEIPSNPYNEGSQNLNSFIITNSVPDINLEHNKVLLPKMEKYSVSDNKLFKNILSLDRYLLKTIKEKMSEYSSYIDSNNIAHKLGYKFYNYGRYSDYMFDLNNSNAQYLKYIYFFDNIYKNDTLYYSRIGINTLEKAATRLAERIYSIEIYDSIAYKSDIYIVEQINKQNMLRSYFDTHKLLFSSVKSYEDAISYLFEYILRKEVLKESDIDTNEFQTFLDENSSLATSLNNLYDILKQSDKFIDFGGDNSG